MRGSGAGAILNTKRPAMLDVDDLIASPLEFEWSER